MKAVVEHNDCLMVRCILPVDTTFDDYTFKSLYGLENEKGYKEVEVPS